MPADPSSPIPSGLTSLCDADPLQQAEPPHLFAYLATIPDPRARAGRRHPLIAILAMAAAAVVGGARSMTAIAEWAADAPQPVRAALGARRDSPDYCSVPSETTTRRTLGRLDANALATAIGAWLANRDDQTRHHRAIAVDGKTLRGARRDGRQVHLLAAMDHTTRAVLAQRQVDGAPGEVPAFQPPLGDLDLAGVVVTADALQTHREAAEFLVTGKQAHDLFVVKANQPTLLDRLTGWPGTRSPWPTAPATAPTAASSCDPSSGLRPPLRVPARRPGPPGHPHDPPAAHQQVANRDGLCDHQPPFQLARPARLADLLRGHWAIEALHHVRDVTFAEDASQVRTGTGPQVMACLRNLVIGALSRAGPVTSPPCSATTPATPPAPRHPRDHTQMKRTLRENAGALPPHHG